MHNKPSAVRDMDLDTRRQLANRIHLLLRRELGQGIDVVRTLADPLYARDVLLVCDAMPGTEQASLAQQFRGIEPPDRTPPSGDGEAPSGTLSRWPQDQSDFVASRPASQGTEPPIRSAIHPAEPRHWLSPARWLGRA